MTIKPLTHLARPWNAVHHLLAFCAGATLYGKQSNVLSANVLVYFFF